jgi:hypothetical protein
MLKKSIIFFVFSLIFMPTASNSIGIGDPLPTKLCKVCPNPNPDDICVCPIEGPFCFYVEGQAYLNTTGCDKCGGSAPVETNGHCCSNDNPVWNGTSCVSCSPVNLGNPTYKVQSGVCKKVLPMSCGSDDLTTVADSYCWNNWSGCSCNMGSTSGSKSRTCKSGVSGCSTKTDTCTCSCPSGTSHNGVYCTNSATCGCGLEGGSGPQLYRKTDSNTGNVICCRQEKENVGGACVDPVTCSPAGFGQVADSEGCGCN